jgi:thiamine-phosphate pyrophosphorylase
MFPRLYAVLDVDLCRGRQLDPLDVLKKFLAGGATLVQLRDKSSSSADRLTLADAAVAQVHAAGARIIVNDRPDIARLCGADGVHVGQEDLPVGDARAVLGPKALIGISTHDQAQIGSAERTTATYLAVGPIYSTATKDTGYTARGLDFVREAAQQTRRPLVAIGGITLENAPAVIAAGASSVAVISGLLSDDPERSVQSFVALLRAGA